MGAAHTCLNRDSSDRRTGRPRWWRPLWSSPRSPLPRYHIGGSHRARTDPGWRDFSSPQPGRGKDDRAERRPTPPGRRRSLLI